jgi:nucleotide-binding universal stress UspA family protein
MKPRVLVAFDFGEPAVHALAWAADLNRTTGGGPIHMVHAVDTRPAVASESPSLIMLPGPPEIATLEKRMRLAAQEAGAEATFEVALRPVPASATILDVARRMRAELIVMGSHARRGLERLLLGSVAAHVARGAECPVVTVYHPHAEPALRDSVTPLRKSE